MPIYGLRTRPLGQTSYFSLPEGAKKGDYALVEIDKMPVMGEVVSGPLTALPGAREEDLPHASRMATSEDMAIHEKNRALSSEAFEFCKACIKKRKLVMKLVDVEVFFDRGKLVFYFFAPNRIDFRELVKDLVREYHSRIELRQIGVRHETQMVGAIGNCGRVCCCRQYLRKFAPVTIRMAKEQNLFLNPAKISGICGRLMCCLSYEEDNYERFHSECPRPGKKYATEKGVFKILRVNMFTNSLVIAKENNEEKEISLEEWKAMKPERQTSREDDDNGGDNGSVAVDYGDAELNGSLED